MKLLQFVILSLFLNGCAIDLDYVRPNPGLFGKILRDGKPQSGVDVVYSPDYSEDCDRVIGKAISDDNGEFRIPIDREFKFIEISPSDGCEFSGKICLNGMKPWTFEIEGNGHKEYHAGGSVIEDPERLIFMSSEGFCEPPKWLRIDCDLINEVDNLCALAHE